MVRLILIRGSSAVGKTTITKELLKILKTKYSLNCAYISEDDFRKQMQFKYKAKDLIVHENSFEIIKTVIQKLLELDDYDLIFLEGQFRYKEILDKYAKYIKDNNFETTMFQFMCDSDERTRRDTKCRISKGVNPNDANMDGDINSSIPKKAILIDTHKPIEEIIKEVLSKLI